MKKQKSEPKQRVLARIFAQDLNTVIRGGDDDRQIVDLGTGQLNDTTASEGATSESPGTT